MIEFDESEYLKSYVSDEILLAVLAISGLAEKDKLLIRDESDKQNLYELLQSDK